MELTPNQKAVFDVLSPKVGMKMGEICKASRLSPCQVRTCLIALDRQNAVHQDGPQNKTLWFRDVPPPAWDFAPEYIKVSSVFRVGQRYAMQRAK